MKLLDLLVEKLEEWPEGAVCIAQDMQDIIDSAVRAKALEPDA